MSSALLLASIVTLIAVVPLTVLALRSDSDDVAPATGLVVAVGGAEADLNGATLAPGADASFSIEGDDLIAAAWSLSTSDGSPLAEGRAVGAAPYRVELPVGLLDGLEPGQYDLLATVTLEDGSTHRRAARFAVQQG